MPASQVEENLYGIINSYFLQLYKSSKFKFVAKISSFAYHIKLMPRLFPADKCEGEGFIVLYSILQGIIFLSSYDLLRGCFSFSSVQGGVENIQYATNHKWLVAYCTFSTPPFCAGNCSATCSTGSPCMRPPK